MSTSILDISCFGLCVPRIYARPMRHRRTSTVRAKSAGELKSAERGNVVRLEHHIPKDVSQVEIIRDSIRSQWKRLCAAGIAAIACSISSIAAPVLMGILFEYLVVGAPLSQFFTVLSVLCVSYTMEPVLSQFYMRTMIASGEAVLAQLRREIFDRLLHEEVSFFDQHHPTEFTNILSSELGTIRDFVFSNVSRDRGIRSLAEVVGVVVVLFCLSWRLAPVMTGTHLSIQEIRN